MAKKPHPRHPKERDILKAIRRTPPLIGGELPGRKRPAAKRKKRAAPNRKKR